MKFQTPKDKKKITTKILPKRARVLIYSNDENNSWLFINDKFKNKEEAIDWIIKNGLVEKIYRIVLFTGEYRIQPEPKLVEMETPIEDVFNDEPKQEIEIEETFDISSSELPVEDKNLPMSDYDMKAEVNSVILKKQKNE